MDDYESGSAEKRPPSEAPSYDDDDSADESSASRDDNSSEEADERRGAFDMLGLDETDEPAPSAYDLFEQRADPEPPLEELASDEQSLVANEATELNLNAANNELVGTEPGSPEEAAAIAGATFNEAVRERIDSGEELSAETLDAAMNDTAEIMGLDPAELPSEDPPEVAEVLDQDGEEAEEVPESETPSPDLEHTEPVAEQPDDEPVEKTVDLDEDDAPDAEAEAVSDEAEQPEDDAATASSTPPGGAVSGTPPATGPGSPAGTGAAGTAGVPPVPPVGGGMPPVGPGGPGVGPVMGGHGPAFGPGFAPPMPAAAPWMGPGVPAALAAGNALRHNRPHRHWPYVVAGGVVGYLVGRRRGRINTEKKLLPVQQKLERQVGDLQFELALREAKVRKLAYLTAINQPHIHAALPKRLKELQELQKARVKKEDFQRVDNARAAINKLNAPIAEAAAVGLAAKVATMAERKTQKPANQELASAKDMQLPELLQIAERLPIEDRNLRVLYETGRINQHGLRRIIEAYLRGERFDRILAEEIRPGDAVDATMLSGAETQSTPSRAEELPRVASDQSVSSPQMDAMELPGDFAPDKLNSARHDYLAELSSPETSQQMPEAGRDKLLVPVLVGIGIGLVVIAILIFG